MDYDEPDNSWCPGCDGWRRLYERLRARTAELERHLNQVIVERGCKYRRLCESLTAEAHPTPCAACAARRFLGAGRVP
jgi:hypothetical protein